MGSLIVVPSRVVELIGDVLIVADIALARRGWNVVAGAGAADGRQSFPIGRPLKRADAILELGQDLPFSAAHRKNPNLRTRGIRAAGAGRTIGAAAGKEGQACSVRTPSREI